MVLFINMKYRTHLLYRRRLIERPLTISESIKSLVQSSQVKSRCKFNLYFVPKPFLLYLVVRVIYRATELPHWQYRFVHHITFNMYQLSTPQFRSIFISNMQVGSAVVVCLVHERIKMQSRTKKLNIPLVVMQHYRQCPVRVAGGAGWPHLSDPGRHRLGPSAVGFLSAISTWPTWQLFPWNDQYNVEHVVDDQLRLLPS